MRWTTVTTQAINAAIATRLEKKFGVFAIVAETVWDQKELGASGQPTPGQTEQRYGNVEHQTHVGQPSRFVRANEIHTARPPAK